MNDVAFSQLSDALLWMEETYPRSIKLGLARMQAAAERLAVIGFTCPVITVAGTNGKGSTVAALEAIYQVAGYKVGATYSPHLFCYNERIHLNGEPVADGLLLEAMAMVHKRCHDIALTYYEYQVLQALWLFKQYPMDIVILEVGLGGRLDASNVVENDVAVITSIGLDHQDLLGSTKNSIAKEKAGIMQAGGITIYGEAQGQPAILQRAQQLGCSLLQRDAAFWLTEQDENTWSWHSSTENYTQLPRPSVLLDNAATALQAVVSLQQRLPIRAAAIRQGLAQVVLLGRFQVIKEERTWIYDVAHNEASAQKLAEQLAAFPHQGDVHGVVGVLDRKDERAIVMALQESLAFWFVIPLESHLKAEKLFNLLPDGKKALMQDAKAAWLQVMTQTKPGDTIVVFGSFQTVSNMMTLRGGTF